MRFIGIDLAWSEKNTTAAATLEHHGGKTSLLHYCSTLCSTDELVSYAKAGVSGTTLVAIDAPLIVPNVTGQRPCEKMLAHDFGKFDASPHTSNLQRLKGRVRGADVVEALALLGFSHDPNPRCDRCTDRRLVFEVYPHPGHIVLFQRERIVKYKKGTVAKKRVGLRELQGELEKLFFDAGDPRLESTQALQEVLRRPLQELRGKALKEHEDLLDALFCAYLALYYWAWGSERCTMYGDLETGYIITPKLLDH